MTPQKLKWVTRSMHISSLLYVLVIVCFAMIFFAFPDPDLPPEFAYIMVGFMAVFCGAVIAFVEFVASRLKRGKKWAWIASICIAGLFLPSLFLPLGLFMLLGLIDHDVQVYCGIKTPANQTTAA